MKIFDIIITSDKQYFATGTILSINGNNMWYSTYNANTQGTSGGPVIDDNGYVYGINTSIIRSYVTQGTAIYSALFEIIVAEREAAARRWAN